MKKQLPILMLACLASLSASAHDFEVDGIYYNINGSNATVTYMNNNYNSYSGSVTIPASVTYSGDAFAVTSIGYKAFARCTNLTSVTIPNSVTTIDDRAFYESSALTSVNIGEGVTTIGNHAFHGCSGLITLTIPSSVKSIGKNAFHSCTGLTTVYFNATACQNMGYDAETDGYCPVFWGCENMSNLYIGENVTLIPNHAFSMCSGLTSVTIPDSVASFGECAFAGCSALTSVNIGEGVATIGNHAFHGCSGLITVTIPSSVKSIGKNAFHSCTGLTTVYFNATACQNMGYDAETDGYCPVFWGCENMSNLYIGENVILIPNHAFSKCSGLTSVTISDSVTSFGECAFADCSSLAAVTIPNSVTTIDKYAFGGCSSLTSVTIPESVTSVGYNIFIECSNLGAFYGKYASPDNRCLIIDDTLVSFASAGLTSYEIPAIVNVIGNRAFYGCSGLTSVTIPDCVTLIDESAFRKCNGLISVTIPDFVTTIGSKAFRECTGLTSVTIPKSVASISNWAFEGCSNLSSITVKNDNPANISLGTDVFYNVPTSTCILYVPEGSGVLYAKADQWKDFVNIEEVPGAGIEGVSVEEQTSIAAPYYDLTGRCVLNPSNGIFIQNGKKVIVR